jgi:hypothetical protein
VTIVGFSAPRSLFGKASHHHLHHHSDPQAHQQAFNIHKLNCSCHGVGNLWSCLVSCIQTPPRGRGETKKWTVGTACLREESIGGTGIQHHVTFIYLIHPTSSDAAGLINTILPTSTSQHTCTYANKTCFCNLDCFSASYLCIRGLFDFLFPISIPKYGPR